MDGLLQKQTKNKKRTTFFYPFVDALRILVEKGIC
jgi:hypothetical protein